MGEWLIQPSPVIYQFQSHFRRGAAEGGGYSAVMAGEGFLGHSWQGACFMISVGADVMKRLIFGGVAAAAIATTLAVAAAIQWDQLIWWLNYVIIYM